MTRFRDGLVLIAGALAAYALLMIAQSRFAIKTDELAFGTETANVLGTVDGLIAHCIGAKDSPDCENAYSESGKPPSILWVGNSQLPAINRFEIGQENAPQILFRQLQGRNRYLITYSQPNANLSEHAVVINSVMPIYQPDLVILPVVFDDIREQGVREIVQDFTKRADLLSHVKASKSWPLIKNNLSGQTGAPGGGTAILGLEKDTLQKKTERAFTGFLGMHWSLWAARPKLRGTLSSAKHILRNKILGIHSYTKRRVNPQIYKERMALLEQIIMDIQVSGAQILLYIPPYRDDIDGPYVATEYDRFKSDFRALAAKTDSEFLDMERIVPGVQWATVTDTIFGFKEPDFMHFTEQGHIAMAQALDAKLKDMGY